MSYIKNDGFSGCWQRSVSCTDTQVRNCNVYFWYIYRFTIMCYKRLFIYTYLNNLCVNSLRLRIFLSKNKMDTAEKSTIKDNNYIIFQILSSLKNDSNALSKSCKFFVGAI